MSNLVHWSTLDLATRKFLLCLHTEICANYFVLANCSHETSFVYNPQNLAIIVHRSLLYKNIVSTYPLKTPSLVARLTDLFLKIF